MNYIDILKIGKNTSQLFWDWIRIIRTDGKKTATLKINGQHYTVRTNIMILADKYSRPLTEPAIIPDLKYSSSVSSSSSRGRDIIYLNTLTNFEVLNEPGSELVVFLNENPV